MARNTSTQSQVEAVEVEAVEVTVEERQAVMAEAYRAGDRAAKAAIRSEVNSEIKSAGAALDMELWMKWQTFATTLAPEAKAKVEVNYQRLVSVHAEALRQLAQAYESGTLRPEGTPEDFVFDQEAPLEFDGTSDEEVAAEAARVHKAVRLISGTKAPKGNITAHIEAVFAGQATDGPAGNVIEVESGTFLTEAQIQRACTEAYPEGTPKGGNVHASLFGTSDKVAAWTAKGIIPTEGTSAHPAGATKA